jgi:hypothetical protein
MHPRQVHLPLKIQILACLLISTSSAIAAAGDSFHVVLKENGGNSVRTPLNTVVPFGKVKVK